MTRIAKDTPSLADTSFKQPELPDMSTRTSLIVSAVIGVVIAAGCIYLAMSIGDTVEDIAAKNIATSLSIFDL